MWNIREVMVNTSRKNICRQSSSPSLFCMIYNYVWLHFLILYLRECTIFCSLIHHGTEEEWADSAPMTVQVHNCLLIHCGKNYTHANAILYSTDGAVTFKQCLPDSNQWVGLYLEFLLLQNSCQFPLKTTSALTQTVACIKLVPRTRCVLTFKMTPTLYTNTMLAIPYSGNESRIFVCYNTVRFVDTDIVLGPVHPLYVYHGLGHVEKSLER